MKRIIEIDKDLYESIAGKNTDQVEPRQVVRSFQATIADAIAQSKPYDEVEVWRKSNELLKKRLRYLGDPTGDLISRSALLNQIDTTDWSDVRLLVEDAPSVEPERPQGKWIDHTATQNLLWGHWECPFCHKRSNRGASYCQYCGARLENNEE